MIFACVIFAAAVGLLSLADASAVSDPHWLDGAVVALAVGLGLHTI